MINFKKKQNFIVASFINEDTNNLEYSTRLYKEDFKKIILEFGRNKDQTLIKDISNTVELTVELYENFDTIILRLNKYMFNCDYSVDIKKFIEQEKLLK